MLSSSLYAALDQSYSLGTIQNAAPLTGGEWNTVLRLDSDRGAFVLRLSHPTNTAPSLLYEHRLLQFMSRQIPEVPAPNPTHAGSTYLAHDDRLLTLFPFMPGRMLDDQNEAERMAAARMFARLQRAGLAYPAWQVRLTIERPDQYDAVVDFTPAVAARPQPDPVLVVEPQVQPDATSIQLVTGSVALAFGIGFLLAATTRRKWRFDLLAAGLVVLGTSQQCHGRCYHIRRNETTGKRRSSLR